MTIEATSANPRNASPWGHVGLGRRVATVLAALGLAVLVPATSADAETSGRCEITQVTTSTQVSEFEFGNQIGRESLSGDGYRLVFDSDRDLTGDNPHGQVQVFFHDVTTGDTQQVTTTQGGGAAISADGSRVAYVSWDGVDSGEIYTYDPDSSSITQLTSDERSKTLMSMSADGTRFLYLADSADILVPRTMEIVDVTSGRIIEVAEPGGHVGRDGTVISPDGTVVAFASRANITGENPDNSSEIFVFDATTETLTQITSAVGGVNGGGGTGDVQFTDDGATVIFSTDAAVLGPNPTNAFLDYHYDVATGAVTAAPDLPVGRAGLGAWSPDGTRFQVAASEDPTGDNPERNAELFDYDPATGDITQLTSAASTRYGSVPGRSMASDGSTIAFTANANLTGGNPDHNHEIYLATTCDPSPRPDAQIATAAAGPFAGRNVYSAAPRSTQRATAAVPGRATRRFVARIQNDRAAPDTFTIKGADAGSPGFAVAYRADGTDITDQIEAGTYTVGPLEPGESATIKIKVTASTDAGSGHRVDLQARSATNPASRDTIRARVTRG